MLDKLKGLWYYKDMNDRLGLSLNNQAVGADHPELKPLERENLSLKGEAHKWEEVIPCLLGRGSRPWGEAHKWEEVIGGFG
jgi:hypothetical protein